MNFSNFEYFYELSKSSSVREAAARMNISQQALSSQIRRLEEELGVPLITDKRPATLTPCGKVFAEFSGEMLLKRRELLKTLADLSGQNREIFLSISKEGCPPILADAITAFAQEEPGCAIRLEERGDNFTDNDFKKYDFNFSTERLSSDLEYIQLQNESYGPIAGADLDKTRSNIISVAVSVQLLRKKWGENWRAEAEDMEKTKDLSRMEGVPYVRVESFGAIVDKYFLEKGYRPVTAATVSSPEAALSLCQAGVGILLAPDGWLIKQLGDQHPNVVVIPLDQTFPATDFFISYQKGKVLSPNEQAFLRCLCDSTPS